MQGRSAVLCLAMLLLVTSARAEETKTPAEKSQAESRPNRLQAVGDIDVRLMLETDILLAFVNGGVGADLGLLELGPGVLAVGGEVEVGACVTFCLGLNLLTGWNFSNMFYAPHARVTYHFLPGSSRGLENLDLYGLVFGGITYTTTSVSGASANAPFEYKGSDVGPSLGAGVGGKYFFKDNNFFVGAEGRARWSAGQYNYTVQVGNVTLSDTQSSWSLSGVHVQLFAGLRL
jgi:hypothetical protein